MFFRRMLFFCVALLFCTGCACARRMSEAAPALAVPGEYEAGKERLPDILEDIQRLEAGTAGSSLKFALVSSRLLAWAEVEEDAGKELRETVSGLGQSAKERLGAPLRGMMALCTSLTERRLSALMLDAGCLRPGQPGDRERLIELLAAMAEGLTG